MAGQEDALLQRARAGLSAFRSSGVHVLEAYISPAGSTGAPAAPAAAAGPAARGSTGASSRRPTAGARLATRAKPSSSLAAAAAAAAGPWAPDLGGGRAGAMGAGLGPGARTGPVGRPVRAGTVAGHRMGPTEGAALVAAHRLALSGGEGTGEPAADASDPAAHEAAHLRVAEAVEVAVPGPSGTGVGFAAGARGAVGPGASGGEGQGADAGSTGSNGTCTASRQPGSTGTVWTGGIAADNVGFRLLKAAGWRVGTGLGAEGQGRTMPLDPTANMGQRGLGYDSRAAQAKQAREQEQGQAQQGQQGGQGGAEGRVKGGGKGVTTLGKRMAELAQQELASESLDVKVKRHKQVMRAEEDEARGRAIASYLRRAFNDPFDSIRSADANPLGRQHALRSTNPLLDPID